MAASIVFVPLKARRLLRRRLVRVVSARLGGSFVGMVRRAGPRHVVVQRPGMRFGARSYSARCCGTRVRCTWAEVVGVLDRRRAEGIVPLADFLRGHFGKADP